MIIVDCPFCDETNEIEIDNLFDYIDYTSTTEEEICEHCNSTFSFELSVDLDIDIYNVKKEKSAEVEGEEGKVFFKDKYTMPLF
jgi:hypothetical protein